MSTNHKRNFILLGSTIALVATVIVLFISNNLDDDDESVDVLEQVDYVYAEQAEISTSNDSINEEVFISIRNGHEGAFTLSSQINTPFPSGALSPEVAAYMGMGYIRDIFGVSDSLISHINISTVLNLGMVLWMGSVTGDMDNPPFSEYFFAIDAVTGRLLATEYVEDLESSLEARGGIVAFSSYVNDEVSRHMYEWYYPHSTVTLYARLEVLGLTLQDLDYYESIATGLAERFFYPIHVESVDIGLMQTVEEYILPLRYGVYSHASLTEDGDLFIRHIGTYFTAVSYNGDSLLISVSPRDLPTSIALILL